MRPSSFLSKLIAYVNNKYVARKIDRPWWRLVDPQGHIRIKALLFEDHSERITDFYPGTDLVAEERNNPPYYRFLMHMFSKYVYEISNCLVDPDYQWVIVGRRQIFRYSFPMAEDPWDAEKLRPSLTKFLLKRRPIPIEKAILVKYNWGNYYHFFNDTLPQLMLAEQMGIPPEVPVIVPAKFSNVTYVQEYFNRIMPSPRRFIVQKNGEYLNVNKLYVLKDTFFSASINLLHRQIPAIVARKNSVAPQFIYVTRAARHRRNAANAAALEAVALEYGFSIVDPGSCSLLEQINMFADARAVIGVHGAALTNILFCKSDHLKVLEIFPGRNVIPAHYGNMCKVLGYEYDFLIGDGLDENVSFHLNTVLFREKVEQILYKLK